MVLFYCCFLFLEAGCQGSSFLSLKTSDVRKQPSQRIFSGTLALWDDPQNRASRSEKVRKCHRLHQWCSWEFTMHSTHSRLWKVLQKGNGLHSVSQGYLTTKPLFCITPTCVWGEPVFSEAHYQEMPETSFISRSFVSEDSVPCLETGSRKNSKDSWSLSLYLVKHIA